MKKHFDMNTINSVVVFCGSKFGNNPLFKLHAEELGSLLAKHKKTIVYGGGSVGIMGTIANAALKENGNVIGVIPKLLLEWEQDHKSLTQLHVTESMHDRKVLLYNLADAVIILPGGYGTLDELFETITWNNLKIHNKKVFILNTAGFYNHLLSHIETMQQEGFLYNDWQEQIKVVDNAEELIAQLI